MNKSGSRNQNQSATSSRSNASGSAHAESAGGDAADSSAANKPLAATLLQEFQNLKDKFKNEDDSQDKGRHWIH